MDDGGQGLEPEAADGGEVGVGEGEDVDGPVAQERAGLVGGAPDEEGHAAVGLVVVGEDAPRRLDQPRAALAERVEGDEHEVEDREPRAHRPRLAVDRRQQQVG